MSVSGEQDAEARYVEKKRILGYISPPPPPPFRNETLDLQMTGFKHPSPPPPAPSPPPPSPPPLPSAVADANAEALGRAVKERLEKMEAARAQQQQQATPEDADPFYAALSEPPPPPRDVWAEVIEQARREDDAHAAALAQSRSSSSSLSSTKLLSLVQAGAHHVATAPKRLLLRGRPKAEDEQEAVRMRSGSARRSLLGRMSGYVGLPSRDAGYIAQLAKQPGYATADMRAQSERLQRMDKMGVPAQRLGWGSHLDMAAEVEATKREMAVTQLANMELDRDRADAVQVCVCVPRLPQLQPKTQRWEAQTALHNLWCQPLRMGDAAQIHPACG